MRAHWGGANPFVCGFADGERSSNLISFKLSREQMLYVINFNFPFLFVVFEIARRLYFIFHRQWKGHKSITSSIYCVFQPIRNVYCKYCKYVLIQACGVFFVCFPSRFWSKESSGKLLIGKNVKMRFSNHRHYKFNRRQTWKIHTEIWPFSDSKFACSADFHCVKQTKKKCRYDSCAWKQNGLQEGRLCTIFVYNDFHWINCKQSLVRCYFGFAFPYFCMSSSYNLYK